jgi:DNA-binding NtrC family response regulator
VRRDRLVVLVSADSALRRRIADTLVELRWDVRQASGGAELFAHMQALSAGTVLLDSWLPDLDVGECVRELEAQYPGVDVMAMDGTDFGAAPAQGAYRSEALLALHRAQEADEAAWSPAPSAAEILRDRRPARRGSAPGEAGQAATTGPRPGGTEQARSTSSAFNSGSCPASGSRTTSVSGIVPGAKRPVLGARPTPASLPELLGNDPRMVEVSRRIRLVAPRSTAVLVQGPTGTGKELVARALHRLSPRAAKPFVALNCAAIPEALLEAELFGHSRGAFTGAVSGRIGRLEAANGGTLFLDEIGELPLAMQAKLLRFVECGELQRVGENEPVRVDVRIVAATHRKLGQMAAAGTFRADLYYRLSVFLIQTPALCGRADDIALLAHHALDRLAHREGLKTLTGEAMLQLLSHSWPGNVRELEHTLERAWILAADSDSIGADDIDFGENYEA